MERWRILQPYRFRELKILTTFAPQISDTADWIIINKKIKLKKNETNSFHADQGCDAKKKITDKELIKRLGKSRQYVTAIANERRRASVATYARFAKALDVPLAALFDGYPLDLLSTKE